MIPGVPSPARHGFVHVIRDALPVAGLALLLFQGLRTCVCERYLVPSDSMQPTLFGDPKHGDVVLVDKLASRSRLQLHDLVVVKNPADPGRLLVKRVAALGDDPQRCYVALQDGDLWLGPDPQQLQQDRKHPLSMRDMRITWFEFPPRGAAEPVDHFLAPGAAFAATAPPLPACADSDAELLAAVSPIERRRGFEAMPPRLFPPGWLGTARPVETTYLDIHGNRHRDDEVVVHDAGVELDLAGAGALQGVVLGMDQRPDTYAWIVRQDVRFFRNGQPLGEPLPRRGSLDHVEFGFLDGCFFLVLGDQLVDWRPRLPEWVTADAPAARQPPKSLLFWRALGNDGATLQHLRVFRDLWYAPVRAVNRTPGPQHVAPGTAFLLGDNGFDSDDSRQHGPYSLRDFVGRPCLVLGPWPRFAWLPR